MVNETQNLQYAGRRRAPSDEEAQAIGRTLGDMASSVAAVAPYNRMPPTDFPAAQPNAALPIPPKRGLSKHPIIAICAAVGLILTLSVIGIVASLSSKTGKTLPVDQSASAASSRPAVVESSEATPMEQPEISEAPASVSVGDGEFLYTGHMDCDQAEDFLLSFVLSSDLSYIHDIKIEITNLKASVDNGSTTTTVEVSGLTETYSGEYPVDFGYGGSDIQIGRSRIRNLYFYENGAYAELDYVYYSTGLGTDRDIEIPLGAVYGELTTKTAPKPANTGTEEDSSAEEAEKISTQTVFDYDKLKNWIYDLPGGGHDFEPATPEPMHYIVCADTVIDPVTWAESAGGYENNYTRHKPVSTDDVLRHSGKLNDGGLILTDDPNLATYALIITFAYDHTGTFTFSDSPAVTQYHGTTKAELYNMITGQSIYTGDLNTFATYANESVYTAMLDNAKGKQLYAQSHTVSASDFSGYWDFIEN